MGEGQLTTLVVGALIGLGTAVMVALVNHVLTIRREEKAREYDLLTRELERLEQTPAAAAEHSVIRTYLEWMVDVPWKEES